MSDMYEDIKKLKEERDELLLLLKDFSQGYYMAAASDSWVRMNSAARRKLNEANIKFLEYQLKEK